MSYDYYEDGGNIKLVNPEGYDELNRQVADGTFAFVCNKCGNLLDRWYNGKWVADAPHVNAMSGYFISQLNAVWVNYAPLHSNVY